MDIDALWASEAEGHIDAYEAGELTARPAADVFADMEGEPSESVTRSP